MTCSNANFSGLVICVVNVLNLLTGVILGLALVYFLWGVVQYIKQSGNPKERGEAAKRITMGLVALLVMVGVWGFVNIFKGILNLDESRAPKPNTEIKVSI